MSLYKYKYINSEGVEVEEIKEFVNKAELYNSIRKDRGKIISAESYKENHFKINLVFSRGIKQQDLINFVNNLAVMIDAGLSVSRALNVMKKQAKSKKLIAIYDALIDGINRGEPLSNAMEKDKSVFPDLLISMVKAGEESGKLSYALRTVGIQLEKSSTLSKKIKGAMIYPAVIISLMIVIGSLLMIYMVPTLTETFKGLNIDLPLPTRIIIAISDFMRANVLSLLLFFVALIVGITYFLRTEKGKRVFQFTVLKMPIFGAMSREANAARTTRTLASLISSGVDIVGAIGITSNVVQNLYFRDILLSTSKKVEVGGLLSESLAEGKLYPIFVSEMLSVGEETGKMTDMLDNVAKYYETEIDQKTKDLSTIIEPILMIFIGVAVGLFAVSMLLPTYSLVDAIQ